MPCLRILRATAASVGSPLVRTWSRGEVPMRGRRRLVPHAVLLAASVALAACAATIPTAPSSAPLTATGTAAAPSTTTATSSATPTPPASGAPSTASTGPRTTGALAGAVVVLDPGHDGGNARAPGVINRLVDIGTGRKTCDTAGTETAAGYPEHAFTWDLATRLPHGCGPGAPGSSSPGTAT